MSISETPEAATAEEGRTIGWQRSSEREYRSELSVRNW